MLTLSLIIPVYNEERHIRGCLDAVAAQTTMPDEVIVVDNNCTDNTIEIANEYPFVIVVTEERQGRGHARTSGFNAAKGDVLGRIDADSRINPDWTAEAKKTFESYPELAGVTGIARSAFFPGINVIKSTLMSRSYFWFAHAQFNTVTMWGANMAIQKDWWDRVKHNVCLDDQQVHEDQDLSLWIAGAGGRMGVNNELRITTNGQGYRYLPKLTHYIRLYQRTFSLHKQNGNLDSPDYPRLGFWRTLPGRLYALPVLVYIYTGAIILFPIDFIVNKLWPKSWWLD